VYIRVMHDLVGDGVGIALASIGAMVKNNRDAAHAVACIAYEMTVPADDAGCKHFVATGALCFKGHLMIYK
jgi:hypothetical protein